MKFSRDAHIILASGSRYRQVLLEQIGLRYIACPAAIDESPAAGELPAATALRLAAEKARAVAHLYPNALIIGSDQVGSEDGVTAFSKPGNHAEAVAQLMRLSGRTARFHTAVCLLNVSASSQRTALSSTEVQYRTLSPDVIETYLRRDQPYDCAGSAKIERLGIALVERVTSDDPTALLGLPLISLIDLLAAEGIRAL